MGKVLFAQARPSGTPPELSLRLGGVQLVGTSLAARATAFALPELEVSVDVGRLTPIVAQQPNLLLTHAHLDHTAGLLAYLNLRARLYHHQPTRVWVPAPVHGELLRSLTLFPGMASVAKRLPLAETILPAEDGQGVPLGRVTARAFAVAHGVPTLGWALTLPGEHEPLMVFAADGDPRFFADKPQLLRARVAVVECTYVETNRRLAARLAQHAHILDWLELAPLIPAETLVLAHLPEQLPEPALLARLAAAFPGQVILWAPAPSL